MKGLYKTFFSVVLIVLLSGSVSLDQATYNLARKLSAAGRYAEAAVEYKKIVYNYPDSRYYLAALYELANSYRMSGEEEKAAMLFRKLYKKSNSSVQKQRAMYGLGLSEYGLNHWQKAIALFNSFNSRYPQSALRPGTLLYTGLSLENSGQIKAALQIYRGLTAHFPWTHESEIAISRIKKLSAVYAQPVAVKKSPEVVPIVTNNTSVKKQITKVTPPLSFTGHVEGLDLLRKVKAVIKTNTVKPQQILISTNIITLTRTNELIITNISVLTQKVKVLDTNAIMLDKKQDMIKKKQEEIERMRRLLEIKARLLELKEKAIRDKTEILIKKKGNNS